MEQGKAMVDLGSGAIGAEGSYSIKFEEGKVKMKVDYAGKGAQAGVFVNLEKKYFLQQLKDAIPGGVDDWVIDRLDEIIGEG